jgi:predicted nucleic acid-binding protein
MVENTIKTLKDASRKCIDVYEKVKYFSSAMNVIFENEDTKFKVEEDFKKIRIKRKLKFHDKIILTVVLEKKYEIYVYNITLDTVIESLENRFAKHKEIRTFVRRL